MYTFELQPHLGDDSAVSNKGKELSFLPRPLLVRYALWFVYLRCIIIGIIGLFGSLGFYHLELEALGLRPDTSWALYIAGILVLANLGFYFHVRYMRNSVLAPGIEVDLWLQVIFDLLILTVVVHFIGTLDTNIPFAYLFHIVLACIFFPPRRSLLVTLIASALYLGCVLLETLGVFPITGILVDEALRAYISRAPIVFISSVTSVLGIWFIVWYFASHLSGIVRERNRQLAVSIQRLTQMQDERKKHMLRTTHELKAPFAAIHANTQLLIDGYCGDLTTEAKDVLNRISERSRRLALAIQEMLQMSNLSSISEQSQLPWVKIDISNVLHECIRQIQQIAQETSVIIDENLKPAEATVVEDHLKMLFLNLLSNAVQYSHKEGHVHVYCNSLSGNGAEVCVEDHGIGIKKEKLPHIFEEYYRTEEATQHNKGSTGLGLAIVRHIAGSHNIKIRVESEPNSGTKFILEFPSSEEQLRHVKMEKEKGNGLLADS